MGHIRNPLRKDLMAAYCLFLRAFQLHDRFVDRILQMGEGILPAQQYRSFAAFCRQEITGQLFHTLLLLFPLPFLFSEYTPAGNL